VSDHTKASGSRSVTLTVPLHITFTLGVPGAGPTDAIATPARAGREGRDRPGLHEPSRVRPGLPRLTGDLPAVVLESVADVVL
jgi:hypothetical protein